MKTIAVCAALLVAVLCYGGVAAGDRLSSNLRYVQSRTEGENTTTTTNTTTTDAPPDSDPCYRYTLIKIFCYRPRYWCLSEKECGDEQICCPYGNCGTRCVPSS